MVKLKCAFYITCDDIKELTGQHWSDFMFSNGAENNSYVSLSCDDGTLEDLYEELGDEMWSRNLEDEDLEAFKKDRSSVPNDCYTAFRLANEIDLIETIRFIYGVKDSLLVYICW
jgi:hypothetical protein